MGYLEQAITDLVWLMVDVKRDREEERTCLETSLQAGLTAYLFLKIHLGNYLPMWRLLVEMSLMEVAGSQHFKTDSCNTHKFYIQIEIPAFNGDLDIKEFHDWITEYDKVNEYLGFSEENIVKLVAYNLKGETSFQGRCQIKTQLK